MVFRCCYMAVSAPTAGWRRFWRPTSPATRGWWGGRGRHAGALRGCDGEVIEPLVAEHRGRLVKLMGDGAAAPSSPAWSTRSPAPWPSQASRATRPTCRLRIGINLGDVVVDGDDL